MFLFADNLGVGDLFMAVRGDISIPYDVEGVDAFNISQLSILGFPDTLSEVTKTV